MSIEQEFSDLIAELRADLTKEMGPESWLSVEVGSFGRGKSKMEVSCRATISAGPLQEDANHTTTCGDMRGAYKASLAMAKAATEAKTQFPPVPVMLQIEQVAS